MSRCSTVPAARRRCSRCDGVGEDLEHGPAGLSRVGLLSRSNFCQNCSKPACPMDLADDPPHGFGRAGHQLEQHVLEVRRAAADDLAGGQAHQPLVGVLRKLRSSSTDAPRLRRAAARKQPQAGRE